MSARNKKLLLICSLLYFSAFCFRFYDNPAWAVPSGSKVTARNWLAQANPVDLIRDWFSQYDQIRRTAQMSPAERQRADTILGQGLSLFIPGQEKILAQKLLADLVKRYQNACQQLSNLRIIPATEELHRRYYQYFFDAQRLFSDYLKLQDNLFAVNPSTGQPVASELIERKQALEQLDQSNKFLDQQLRLQYGILPYQY